jgi:hypothetical protein
MNGLSVASAGRGVFAGIGKIVILRAVEGRLCALLEPWTIGQPSASVVPLILRELTPAISPQCN